MTGMECRDRAQGSLAERNAAEWERRVAESAERGEDAGEQERRELLDGIRESLNAGGARSAVSLRLLKHLAAVRS